MTTFSDYQAGALATALPTALNAAYLSHGLAAEWGEVHGVQAKAIRDQWTDEDTRRALSKELGDVVWFVAVLGHHLDADWDPTAPAWRHGTLAATGGDMHLRALLDLLVSRIAINTRGTGRTSYALQDLTRLWNTLADNVELLHGITFDDVLADNLAKLADRQARGTLQGSGDHR